MLNLATTTLGAEEFDADELSLLNKKVTDKAEILNALRQWTSKSCSRWRVWRRDTTGRWVPRRVYWVLAKLKKALGPTTGTLASVAAFVPWASLPSSTVETRTSCSFWSINWKGSYNYWGWNWAPTEAAHAVTPSWPLYEMDCILGLFESAVHWNQHLLRSKSFIIYDHYQKDLPMMPMLGYTCQQPVMPRLFKSQKGGLEINN